jgi:upstream activation factor subunit UAF30
VTADPFPSRKDSDGHPQRESPVRFHEAVTPSTVLAAVIGSKAIPRTDITNRLWACIKKNGLQDSKNERMIRADAALEAVFGGKATVDMFEMTRLV